MRGIIQNTRYRQQHHQKQIYTMPQPTSQSAAPITATKKTITINVSLRDYIIGLREMLELYSEKFNTRLGELEESNRMNHPWFADDECITDIQEKLDELEHRCNPDVLEIIEKLAPTVPVTLPVIDVVATKSGKSYDIE